MTRILLLVLAALPLFASAEGVRLFELDVQLEVGVLPGFAAPELPRDSAGDLDDLTIEERRAIQKRLKLRRKMSNVHQALSFAAAGLIIGADIVGLGNAAALQTGAPTRANLDGALYAHRIFALTGSAAYLGAGITAWTMPDALVLNAAQGKKKADSGDVHVAFSVVHGIAMAAVVGTGIAQANAVPASDTWRGLVAGHTAAGLTAATFVVAGAIVIGTL